MHPAEPGALERPTAQSLQEAESAAENVPAGHTAQRSAPEAAL